MQKFSNNATTVLASLISNSATSLTVASSTPFTSLAVDDYELVTLAYAGLVEIVRVTARVGNVWTITRAQEGTTAQEWPAYTRVEARATAGTLAGMVQRDVDAIAAGSLSVATGVYSVAVGRAATASNTNALAVGFDSVASGYDSIVVGVAASANQPRSIAIGKDSHAYADDSIALGMGDTYSPRSVAVTGFPCIRPDNWYDQYESGAAAGLAVFATPHMDLAVPPSWAGSTVYSHGQIVQPTMGGTVQYRLGADYSSTTLLHNTPTSPATEPTWPGAGDSVEFDETFNDSWIGNDLSAGYDTEAVPTWLEFWPTGIAFICQEYSATTGTPTVSIGTASSPTLILNAASVGITGAGQVFHFTMPNPCPRIPAGEAIRITLNGAASSGVMAGRFVFTGAFVATRSRT